MKKYNRPEKLIDMMMSLSKKIGLILFFVTIMLVVIAPILIMIYVVPEEQDPFTVFISIFISVVIIVMGLRLAYDKIKG